MLKDAKRIVIKVGSSLIIDEKNAARAEWLRSLAADISALKNSGKEVIVVTSGAVALGRAPLAYGARALELEEKQAAAACGQILLFSLWAEVLKTVGLSPAQMLLTADDSIARQRYLNARNTLDRLLENTNIIPVINENDTVATAELRFGDNDRLAARVAQMAGADVLILFSDIDGLFTANPRTNKNAKLVEKVEEITADIEAMAGGAGSFIGTGGMATKIAAAKIATSAGCHMIIAKGIENNALKLLVNGGKCTVFVAKETPHNARKYWINGVHAAGEIWIDDGAAKALKSGKSLLPAGVVSAHGNFDRGDVVTIVNASDKRALGKGLISYAAADASRIIGKKSQEIEQILGFKRRDVLIHRDDLVLE